MKLPTGGCEVLRVTILAAPDVRKYLPAADETYTKHRLRSGEDVSASYQTYDTLRFLCSSKMGILVFSELISDANGNAIGKK